MARALRALVVDDNPANRAILEIILEQLSAETVSVDDGQKAVVAFGNERFDLVLMDLQMPVMDGLTATRRIRELEVGAAAARTPLLAVTAHARDIDVQAALAAGADRHVAKPINPQRLLQVIAEVVAEARASEAAAGGAAPPVRLHS